MEHFHGTDRHKAYSTISVLNREGVEIAFHPCIRDLKAYLDSLRPEDAIVLEASIGVFGGPITSRCARNMAKALWVYMVTGEFGLPAIYKPSIAVRELRKLFAYYNLLNRQILMIKNGIQALLTEKGINLEEAERKLLLKKNGDITVITKLDLTSASILIIRGELELLRNLLECKEKLQKSFYWRALDCKSWSNCSSPSVA